MKKLILVLMILSGCSSAPVWSRSNSENQAENRLRLALGSGAAWGMSSFHTDREGSAEYGEYYTFRAGLAHHRNLVTYISVDTYRLKIKRTDFDISGLDGRWYITSLGFIQRYLFSKRPVQPYTEIGVALYTAERQTSRYVEGISIKTPAAIGGSLGVGLELTFEETTFVEIGGRFHYFHDDQKVKDLSFTFFDVYLGFGFSFR